MAKCFKCKKLTRKLSIFFGILFLIASVWMIYTYVVHIRYNGTAEKVTFKTGDVTLSGWFIKPDVPGPGPAVVLLHGAGPLTGDALPVRIIANAFLRSGVSVLVYDKRGVGESGGTYNRNAYQNFIEDGISAVKYLKSRSDVDKGAIGLMGSSEGGWFTSEIAQKTGDVSFIINRAGSALPKIETELWETRHELKRKGIEGEALDQSIRMREMVWHLMVEVNKDPSLAGGEKWQQIDADLAAFDKRYGDTKAAWTLKKMPDYNPKEFQAFVSVMGYDPQPYIEQINIPILYIYAEDDENIPTAGSVAYLKKLQTQNGNDNIEIKVIPAVEHSMMSIRGFSTCGLDPAYINTIGPWAAEKSGKHTN